MPSVQGQQSELPHSGSLRVACRFCCPLHAIVKVKLLWIYYSYIPCLAEQSMYRVHENYLCICRSKKVYTYRWNLHLHTVLIYFMADICLCQPGQGAPLHVEWALCVVQYMSRTVLTVTCACSQCGVLSATLHRGKPAVHCSQCGFNHYCTDHCRVSPQGLTQCTQQTRVGRGMQEGETVSVVTKATMSSC